MCPARLHPRVEAAGRLQQCVPASRPPPAKLDTPLLKGTRFPITILRKHPIVPSKIEELQDQAQQEQEQSQEQEPSQQQNQEQDQPQAASSTMAPNTPEDPGEPNFNGEEVEEYPETTALITPTSAPTPLTLETPAWPVPSPPTPIARTPARRDSYETQEGGGDLERGATGTSSGRKIIR